MGDGVAFLPIAGRRGVEVGVEYDPATLAVLGWAVRGPSTGSGQAGTCNVRLQARDLRGDKFTLPGTEKTDIDTDRDGDPSAGLKMVHAMAGLVLTEAKDEETGETVLSLPAGVISRVEFP